MGRGECRRHGAAPRSRRDLLCRQPFPSARSRVGAEMNMSTPVRIVFIAFCALVLLYLILPILIIVPMSFSSTRFLTFPPPSLSLRWYHDYVGSSAWMQATRVTVTVALATVAIASPIGVAAAYAIR